MNKQLIVYDVDETGKDLFPQSKEDTYIFPAFPAVRSCIGCFGCWIKTPGTCVIDDRCTSLPRYISRSQEIIFVSPVLYGGFSINIKKILERCIAYLMPYERLVNGEMHHKMRYHNPFHLTVYFYGPCDEEEQEIAERLVAANAVNMGAGSQEVKFYESFSAVKEVLF